MASGPGIAGRLFTKGSVTEQIFIWAILAGIVQALGSPFMEELRQLANLAAQNTRLTPAELADMVVRAIRTEDQGAAEAALAGIDSDRFKALVAAAGEAIGPQDLAEALRRGIIPEGGRGPDAVSFEQGIAESHLRNKWGSVVKDLSVREPTPNDALEALVKGQLTEDQAQDLYKRFGGDLKHFLWLFHTVGEGPTPNEALELANRRIIPYDGQGPDVLSFHQAFLESRFRNKWEPAWRQLGRHLPPPRTVVALIRDGAIDDAHGLQLLEDNGLPPDLAAAYVAGAHHSKSQATRNLTVGAILDLYEAQAIPATTATTLLKDLNYSDQDAAYELTLRDLQREIKAVNGAVTRIGALYIAGKIDKSQATSSLGGLQIPSAQVSELLRTWDLERGLVVKTLTAAEIVAAFHWKIFDQATATEELVGLGYTAFDAWALLSIREHEPLALRPAR